MEEIDPTSGADANRSRRRFSPLRAAAALVLLAGVGLIMGVVTGAIAGALAVVLTGGTDALYIAGFGAIFGAPLGLALGPLLGFGPLRHVPLGRAIGGTALATIVVGSLSAFLVGAFAPLYGAAGAVAVAFVLGADAETPVRLSAGGGRSGAFTRRAPRDAS